MNKEQMLLLKVAEECNEIAQVCSKAIRFGLYNNRPGEDLTNISRIIEEFKDLKAAIFRLECETEENINTINTTELQDRVLKIDKYLQVSRDLGILKG